MNFNGKKLLLVSACKEAKAGKEKLAAAGANIVGTAVAQLPVALTRGVCALKPKAGTRGIVIASTMPILCWRPHQYITISESKGFRLRYAKAKQEEDEHFAGKITTTQPSFSAIPGFPKFLSRLCLSFTLARLGNLV